GVALAEALLNQLQEQAPRKTSVYADAIRTTSETRSGGTSVKAYAPDPLATSLTPGTPPHEIVPVNAKVLRFFGSDGGKVFTQHVNHPGTQPNEFHLRAAEAAVAMTRA